MDLMGCANGVPDWNRTIHLVVCFKCLFYFVVNNLYISLYVYFRAYSDMTDNQFSHD
ncbi:Uncharacterised protein [Yersinia enterocolitica]|uniref:Uncharacterized protein n=1 Tax=Yersinia enterocolitica TaxID=630 RepID=A0A0H5G851_YEREN|nr:Uncharacterised protein [Yersinia enterocolitica]CNB57404.1 Uncharacterised protein [Yersinia enterocolitica]CND86762.1 Uncharacterised protein [Yersinia enterocolitica]CNH18030.1 Uncharacterised protein [Yersinia enterocolitica]CNI45997.1 Uncharacterised protein [Yersinia enterocolitica]